MKRREKKLSVRDWVLVGLLDTLAGVVAGGLMAIWQLPSAYRWRGYWAIGGEWLLVIIAIIMAVRLTHAFQMFMIFGGKKHGKMRSVSQGHYRSGGNRSGVRRKVLRESNSYSGNYRMSKIAFSGDTDGGDGSCKAQIVEVKK